ncbi:MAG: hypothetical protein Q8O83_00170 [bacterium]|nr:hypothetical protein [bacterium]
MRPIYVSSVKLSDFDISETRGFLPDEDPLESIYSSCLEAPDRIWVQRYEPIARMLPKLMFAEAARGFIERESDYFLDHQIKYNKAFNIAEVFDGDKRLLESAMRTLSFIGNAYVWQGSESSTSISHVKDTLPRGFAMLWYQVASALGRHPSLAYSSYALHNWRRLDPSGPIALGNIVLINNFLGGLDEEGFIIPHDEIEAHAGPIPKTSLLLLRGLYYENENHIVRHLCGLRRALKKMYATLQRIPEKCDASFAYYNRVRPPINGWKGNPALPNGLLYPGVSEYEDKPQQFRGETGAQSSIIPLLDALLGIVHAPGQLTEYLMEMREYMPVGHRRFIELIEDFERIDGLSVFQFAEKHKHTKPRIYSLYKECREWVEKFRTLHLEYSHRYIFAHQQKNAANPTQVGTGGTPFPVYLKKHRDETRLENK